MREPGHSAHGDPRPPARQGLVYAGAHRAYLPRFDGATQGVVQELSAQDAAARHPPGDIGELSPALALELRRVPLLML